MRTISCYVLTFLISVTAYAQEYVHDPKTETEVNEQVWKPFKQAYESRDWKAFNDLHTDDVLRVSKWGGIKVGREYKDRVEKSYQKNTPQQKTIDLWFENRIYSGNVGYEVGYYRVIYNEPNKDQMITHSRFHVVLKKIDGVWKIAQDWDTNIINGEEVTAKDFAKGKPIQL